MILCTFRLYSATDLYPLNYMVHIISIGFDETNIANYCGISEGAQKKERTLNFRDCMGFTSSMIDSYIYMITLLLLSSSGIFFS